MRKSWNHERHELHEKGIEIRFLFRVFRVFRGCLSYSRSKYACTTVVVAELESRSSRTSRREVCRGHCLPRRELPDHGGLLRGLQRNGLRILGVGLPGMS